MDSGNDDCYSETSTDSDYVDETDLEVYETSLDKEECPVDEYILFKDTIIRKFRLQGIIMSKYRVRYAE